MNASAAQLYQARFRAVLDHIESHLEGDLSLDRLSRVASFSKFHFQRQFAALFGIGVYRYVQLARLKRAAYQLAFRHDIAIIDVALTSGYEGPEAFARAFKKIADQTPTEFRTNPRWNSWHATYETIGKLRSTHMTVAAQLTDVRIVDFRETKVAALEHRGDPRLIGDSIRTFIEWRKENKLPPQVSATFNIAYDNPDDVDPADYRFAICAATERDVEPNRHGVRSKTIPSGRCAVLRHVGSDDTLAATVIFLYTQWLPASGEDPRDFPLFFQRVKFFPDVSEHEAVTDVFLPIK